MVKPKSRSNSASAMPGRLKILPVEIADAAGAQAIERPGAAAERRWHAQARNCREQIEPEQRQATGAPQSWPMIKAFRSPSAATSATTSPTVSKML